jgi:RNA polymerase primary sigma factor
MSEGKIKLSWIIQKILPVKSARIVRLAFQSIISYNTHSMPHPTEIIEVSNRPDNVLPEDAIIPELPIDDVALLFNVPGEDIQVYEEPTEGQLEQIEQQPENPNDSSDCLEGIDTSELVTMYIKEIYNIPLLTKEQEHELAIRIEAGLSAREEMAETLVDKRRTPELRQRIEDGQAARDQLVLANTRLVISNAKRYIGRGLPFLDLIQEGNIGLMRAVKEFKYYLGFKFSTYATYWIRQTILREISEHSRTIRLPVRLGDVMNRLKRLQNHLAQQLGRAPTIQELADASGFTPKKITAMFTNTRKPVSLEAPIDDDEERDLGDSVPSNDVPPQEVVETKLLREILTAALSTIPPRQALVLRLRSEGLTLKEVGERMGITRERVRQIEEQALRRLDILGIREQLRDARI